MSEIPDDDVEPEAGGGIPDGPPDADDGLQDVFELNGEEV